MARKKMVKAPAKRSSKALAGKRPVAKAKRAKTSAAPKAKAAKPVAAKKKAPLANTKTPPAKQRVAAPSLKSVKVLLCRLDHSASDWVEMSWEDTASKKTWKYYVDREPLRRIAREIRGEVREYSGRPPGKLEILEAISSTFKPDNQEYRDALHALARTGAELHRSALGQGGRTHPKSDSRPFREWFNANVLSAPRGAWRIVMIHKNLDTDVVVPWGLAFALRKDRHGEDEHIDDMEPTPEGMSGFWCLGYAASVVGVGYTSKSETQFELKPNQTKVGIIVEIGDHGIDAHTREDKSYSREDWTYVLDNQKKLKQHANSYRGQNNFFYVSLNAKGGVYQLTDSTLEGRDLALATESIEIGRMVFTMLDGDCVIRGDRGAEWIEDMLMRPDRGVFAVETDISSVQHRFFGWTFMRDAIVAGKPLLEGVTSARVQHWPRSLLYGLYCTPLQAMLEPPPKNFLAATKFVDEIIDGHVAALKQKAKL